MAELVEVTPHISALSLLNATRSNIYYVEDDGGYMLVDPGPVGTAPTILALDRKGELRLTRVLCTHAHPAHAGSLARVTRGTGVPAYVHPDDAPYLDGRQPPLLPKGRRGQLIEALGRLVDLCPPLYKLEAIVPGEAIGPLLPVAVPGHSPGHVAFLHQEDRALLCGDALFWDGEQLGFGDDDLSEAPERARQSAQALRELEFDHLLAGHGPPLLGRARDVVRLFLTEHAS